MSVKTQKEVNEGKSSTETMDLNGVKGGEVKASPPKPLNLIGKFVFPPAPKKGKSNCAFWYKGKEVSLSLVDGEYIIPKKLKHHEKLEMAEMLRASGFEDKSYFVDSPKSDGKKKKKDEEPVKVYKFFHPDHIEENPINGEYNFSKKQKIEFVNGVAEVTDEKIKDRCEKAGFLLVSEKDEEEAEE